MSDIIFIFRLVLSLGCRRTLEQMFEDFAEKPVASGSIAQIHKARLSAGGAQDSDHPQGTTVAVKVRPHMLLDALEHSVSVSSKSAC